MSRIAAQDVKLDAVHEELIGVKDTVKSQSHSLAVKMDSRELEYRQSQYELYSRTGRELLSKVS
jgi:hypothetical protein